MSGVPRSLPGADLALSTYPRRCPKRWQKPPAPVKNQEPPQLRDDGYDGQYWCAKMAQMMVNDDLCSLVNAVNEPVMMRELDDVC